MSFTFTECLFRSKKNASNEKVTIAMVRVSVSVV